jgi:hypothetical protein
MELWRAGCHHRHVKTHQIRKPARVGALLLVMAVGSIGMNGSAQGDAPGWQIVPVTAVKWQELSGIAAVSPTDVWAVGLQRDADGNNRTLTEHWNGSSSQVVPSPNVGPKSNWLRDVVAISATDVWAVGNHDNFKATNSMTLIEHWNGSAWHVVPSPSTAVGNDLVSVTAASATDVWAVGSASGSGLIEHWDGSSWSAVSHPEFAHRDEMLVDVSASSSSDVWAVGNRYTWRGQVAIAEHWDGTSWRKVPVPNFTGGDNHLDGVAAVSPTAAWAISAHEWANYVTENYHRKQLIDHWDGAAWQARFPVQVGLADIAAPSAADVWAVGAQGSPTRNQVVTAIVHRVPGVGWTAVPSPNIGPGPNTLSKISYDSPTDLWALGTYHQWKPLILHYSSS